LPGSVIFPSDSPNGAEMADALENCRLIFFAGLPGTGKSLFVRQQAVLAARAGKRVHFLRWDAVRPTFETDALLQRYPDTDGVTHPVIRKAAGRWARPAIARWHAEFPGSDHVLVGELPISGNRFAELVHVHDDDIEPLLAGDLTRFLVPVPTTEVRRALESKRQDSISSPQHADEARDAPMNILRQVWTDTRSKAADLGLVDGDDAAAADEYDPTTYQRFFQHVLQRRNCRILDVDTVYADVGSSHDLDVPTDELVPSADEIADVLASLEATWTTDQIARSVDAWYEV
jgi:hypothetical protein